MHYSGNSPTKAVRLALEELDFKEKEIVIRYYFMGDSYKTIAGFLKIPPGSVRAIRIKSVEKLKLILEPFVKQRYGLNISAISTCPLCCDSRLDEIILQCAPYGPWAPVMQASKRLKIDSIKTVSSIINHYKNHLLRGTRIGKTT